MTALIFDCDGVLADTERYGHLPAFNATFEHFDLPVRWDAEEYGRRLRIGGGKERMASLFADDGFTEAAGVPDDEVARTELLARWHVYKTAAFKELVAAGKLPGRPGIARIISEAVGSGWTVGVASTSAVESVRAVLDHAVGRHVSDRIPVFAGDMARAKKPDPAIYQLAVDQLGVDPDDTLAIEDSRNGLRAAVGAGLACLVTVNGYTREENFDEAALVVSELGDPGREPIEVLARRCAATPGPYVTLTDLTRCLEKG